MVRGNSSFCVGYGKGLFYFRVFGVGLWFASYKHQPPLFSERNSITKTVKLGPWRMKYLDHPKLRPL